MSALLAVQIIVLAAVFGWLLGLVSLVMFEDQIYTVIDFFWDCVADTLVALRYIVTLPFRLMRRR